MHLFVTLTHECNLKCSYCYGKCCDDFGSDEGEDDDDGFVDVDYDLPDNISYGVSEAQRGWLEPGDVANTLPLDELRNLLGSGL